MNKYLLYLFMFISFWTSAQEYELTEYLFIRVYDSSGKKIHKGELLSITNEGLQLKEKDSIRMVPVKSIGEIRTKHTFGGKILLGAIVGASFGFGIIRGDPETGRSSPFSGQERIAAVGGGAVMGGLIGTGIGLLQKRSIFTINGKTSKLQAFAKVLQE